ncbi:VanZ family protein [Ramlibacter sp. AN1015]|uniref:VanZ family protein n=1 Tax=Ramlibacter sp. AN1015 TaxID=3133428 RepID=UPI0030C43ACC
MNTTLQVRGPSQWRLALFACCAAVLVLATMPIQGPVPTTGWDKSDHVLAFVVLGLLGQRAYPCAVARCQLSLLCFGAGIELLQWMLPHRFAEWRDLMADGAGLVLALTITSLGRRVRKL